jgi:2,4-dienoyl-CoA reductase-like NADH-dependent reductase (Old Yellow Enzyme family)
MAIEKPLTLPCGAEIRNRLAKSAMSENLADANLPGEKLYKLYETWGEGGLGLIITGNIMVDNDELGEPNNVVLEKEIELEKFERWTANAKKHGAKIWAQINHPGRQAPSAISRRTVAPSALKLSVGSLAFRTPSALTEIEIHNIIARFAKTAELCKRVGFDGVQIHGAHGYLVSQFLSPLANIRTDQWGGSVEDRMRFAIEIVRSIRKAVGPKFPIGIKMNSADFQRGGFAEEDSVTVAQALEAEGIDLIEISGGTYEASAMTGAQDVLGSAVDTRSSIPTTGAQDVLGSAADTTSSRPTGAGVAASTAAREAYFLPFAKKIRSQLKTPMMLTGGFRSASAMNAAIADGIVDMVGIARPLAMEPYLAQRLLSNPAASCHIEKVKTGIKMIDRMGALEIGYYSLQLKRIGEGKSPDPKLSPLLALPLLGINYSSGIFQRLLNRAK